MTYRFILFSFLLIFFSCQSDQDKAAGNIADGICTCYQPLMEINDQLEKLLKSGNGKRAESLISKMTSTNSQAKECALQLTKDQRKDNSLDALKLEEAIQDNCPKIWPSVKELLFEK